jgi:uncharacterized membrane protein YkvA (DUF1232 family)
VKIRVQFLYPKQNWRAHRLFYIYAFTGEVIMSTPSEHNLVSSSDYEPSVSQAEDQKETLLARALRYTKNLAQFVRLLIELLMDPRVDTKMKVFVGAVLTYVFAPIDFIPELFSGLFGMLDDFVLSAFALNVILNWVDPEIVKSHWHGESDLLETVQKGIKNAELLVPEAIVKKIQLWVGRHAEKALATVQAPAPEPEVSAEKPRTRRRTKKS